MTLGKIVDPMVRQATHTWENPSWWNILVVLPWTVGAIFFIYQWNVDRDIATREQTTQGVIAAHEPANHNRFGYVFSVNGKNFTGWESPGKDGLDIGQQVLVYYDPLNPSKNALTEFRDLGTNSLGPVPMMLFGIGAVAWYIRAQRRKSQASSNRRAAPVAASPS
jgi:hypothetical protein